MYKSTLIVILWIFSILHAFDAQSTLLLGRANANEWFSTKIEPKIFNLTLEQPNQFDYRFSLKGYPDLPSWMRFMYSTEYNAGFLYGTPPEYLAGQEVLFDVIALNKLNYEPTHVVLSLVVTRKIGHHMNTVQMKIDNLNWVHLMDPGRVENLKNIFRHDLWPESKNDLHISLMESAIKMGGRIPLRPQQREGVIVHLSSHNSFSLRLSELQEEVKPLYKIHSCTYKRTSVQTIFEKAGFKLDWCAFHIVANGAETAKNTHELKQIDDEKLDLWEPMTRFDAPQRNYIDEFAFAIAIPGVILAILVAILSVILCFQHEKIFDPSSELYFQNIFHICEELRAQKSQMNADTVQVVQYSDTYNQPTTSLKSLKDLNTLVDNISLNSNSPNNSLYRINCMASGSSTLRPHPPPYKPKNLHGNGSNI